MPSFRRAKSRQGRETRLTSATVPQPAVSGFMTGSAINIAAGQVPALFGINKRLDTRAATYQVIINTFKNLKYSK